MGLLDALILGVVQGLTEFLPVSSSGHLALGKHLLGLATHGLMFEVAVHVATALAVVLAYRRRISGLAEALPSVCKPSAWKVPPGADKLTLERAENVRLIFFLAWGTVPAGVAGVLLRDTVENAFNSPRMVCWMLIATGVVLIASRLAPQDSGRGLTWTRVLIIGVAQAFALLPGISRSGMTITAALLCGLSPGRAAEFSFLLALPAILGAAAVEIVSQFSAVPPEFPGTWALVTGLGAAFFSGLAAIFFLLKTLRKGRFDRFAWYCWALAGAGLFLF
ncbi:MAG: undecaprenyl-diphosphate phosphatase [Candidatus Glassbacteria bacterium]|nr:undecaprenyl-diphosphate phosphatase [Candidatus Glassbacteria bacterium]